MRQPTIDASMISFAQATREPPSLSDPPTPDETQRITRRRSRRTQIFTRMERVRAFTMLIESLSGNRDVASSPGSEPVPVGVCSALGPSDTLVATYAESAFALASGGDARSIALRVIDRARGSRGPGEKKLANPTARCIEARDFASHRIGLVISLAVSDRLNGRRRGLVCAIDGARADDRELRDAIQGAADWHLPIVFAIETNRLQPHDGERLARLARELKLAYDEVWGFDPLIVTETVHHAIGASLEDDQPRLVEVLTAYEDVTTHDEDSDPSPFGGAEDPIAVFRETIECAGEAKLSELVEITANVRSDMRRLTFELANEHDGIVSPHSA
jgi:pyruvate dehydrogenase E1 component alpha subunit